MMTADAMTAELTALLNEDAARLEARTQANISRRAETLWEDGYKVRSTAPGLFLVTSPQGDFYSVRVSVAAAPFGSYCSCPCFETRQKCQHLLAVIAAIEEGAACDAFTDFLAGLDDDQHPEF